MISVFFMLFGIHHIFETIPSLLVCLQYVLDVTEVPDVSYPVFLAWSLKINELQHVCPNAAVAGISLRSPVQGRGSGRSSGDNVKYVVYRGSGTSNDCCGFLLNKCQEKDVSNCKSLLPHSIL